MKDMSYPFDLDNASPVRVKPMPSVLRKLARTIVKPRACFYNSATIMLNACKRDMKYVIGYAAAPIATEHAWIKVGDTYYDPTWELNDLPFGKEYLPLYELDMGEMISTMNAMDTLEPPCALSLYYFRSRSS
jgi:hypothetical protein